MKESVREDICDPFTNYGIFSKTGCFYEYATTVKILKSLFDLQNKKNSSVYDVLQSIGKDMRVGPYEEYRYEYGCREIDTKSFNISVSRELDEIKEKILEKMEDSSHEEYSKIVDEVLSNYKVGEWYDTPKKTHQFRIDKVDFSNNKIYLLVVKVPEQKYERRSLSLEEFNSFLHNFELFERKILKSKKYL
jgi:hypothetical protein